MIHADTERGLIFRDHLSMMQLHWRLAWRMTMNPWSFATEAVASMGESTKWLILSIVAIAVGITHHVVTYTFDVPFVFRTSTESTSHRVMAEGLAGAE